MIGAKLDMVAVVESKCRAQLAMIINDAYRSLPATTMPKLHLKRTPQEEAHYARKRQRKQERRRREELDDNDGPGPSDYANIQAEIEEARFREKMSLAFEDDERLDSLEARMNDFAHVPMRWGGTGSTNVYEGDDYLKMDPLQMDDEEYAEWVRVGMYRQVYSNRNDHHLTKQ